MAKLLRFGSRREEIESGNENKNEDKNENRNENNNDSFIIEEEFVDLADEKHYRSTSELRLKNLIEKSNYFWLLYSLMDHH